MKSLKSGVLLIGLFLCSTLIHSNEVAYKTEVIVEGLDNPWSIAFVSENHWLVTERTGDLRTVKDGVLQSDGWILRIPDFRRQTVLIITATIWASFGAGDRIVLLRQLPSY